MKVTDQLNRIVDITGEPQRIVSLVPSITELLHDLHLNREVAGITKFCIHPDHWFRTKPRVGGTKKVNHETIAGLNPDLIIANKEENNPEDIHELEKEYPVWVSDVNDFESALDMITALGNITNRSSEATRITGEIRRQFDAIRKLNPLKVLYLIWKDPFMAAGNDTFISDIINRCGWENAAGNLSRYPSLTSDEMKRLAPDIILLSSEPYPFKEIHVQQIQQETGIPCITADGEMFSWYGSRMIKAPGYFNDLIPQVQHIIRLSQVVNHQR